MQIRIVQSEIEQAITDYISSRLTVADGQRIDIALSATRGEDGFVATIDIVAADSPKPEVAAAPAPAAKSEAAPVKAAAANANTASKTTVKVEPKAEPKAEVKQPDPEPVKQETASTAGADANSAEAAKPAGDEPPFDTEEKQAAAEATAQTENASAEDAAQAEAEVKPVRSLFAGLKKPVNS